MIKRRAVVALIVITNMVILIAVTLQLSAFDKPSPLAPGPLTILTPFASSDQAEQMAALLAAESGLEVRAVIPGCEGSAVDMLGLGQADTSFLSALAYTESADKYGSEVAMVAKRFGATDLGGQIMVRSDAGYGTVNDLAGVNVAFPAEDSRSGYLLPIFHLSRTHGINANTFFNELIETGSHDNAARAVYNKDFESTSIQAGFAYYDVRLGLLGELPDIFTVVDVLEETVRIPNDTLSNRPNMDPALAEQLFHAMSDVASSAEGEALLLELYGMDYLKPAKDADYDITREYAAFWSLDSGSCSEAAIITPDAGGTVTLIDDFERLIKAELPAKVTTETLKLSLTSLPAATHLPDHLTSVGPVIDITGVVSDTTKLVTTLSGPFTLTSGYSFEMSSLPEESTVAWYYWDGKNWVYEPSSTVDAGNNIITAKPSYFSIWAVLEDHKSAYLPLVLRAP